MELAWLLIALPLLASAVLGLRGRRMDETEIGTLACGAVAGSFLLALLLMLDVAVRHGAAVVVGGPTWVSVGALNLALSLQVDPLSLTMTLVVTGVGLVIHLFARGYMHGDPHYPRFFALLNLFVGMMLILVLASNLAFMFVGWEGVGFCSYMLIGYYTHKPSAHQAGKKAFIVNRIGDLGFMLGAFLVYRAFGTLEFTAISEQSPTVLAAGGAAAIAFFLFVGACGKSAQFPLYVWLPDAMEGPTPVSALIHAATMVTAGVYLVVRMGMVFALAPAVLNLVAVVGLLTAVLAALLALVQNDIKRVLAYSTISQLGYMFLAAGMGAYTAAIFHLVTHAFFKALLFLGSGSVIHAMEHAIHHAGRCDDPQDMRHMGGLRERMPTTHWTMLVGALAISGCPLLAGFWSKDEILFATSRHSYLLWLVGLGVALLTAFYMFRLILKTFYQEPKLGPAVHDQVVESSAVMTLPLRILGVLSILGGVLNLPGHWFGAGWLHHWLHPTLGPSLELLAGGREGNELLGMVISSIVALTGIGLACSCYAAGRGRGAALAARYPRVYGALVAKYWLDETYRRYLVEPGNELAETCAAVIDAGVVDGSVNLLGRWVLALGQDVRDYQPGLVRSYALWFVVGAVGVVGYLGLVGLGPWAAGLALVLLATLAGAVAWVVRPRNEG